VSLSNQTQQQDVSGSKAEPQCGPGNGGALRQAQVWPAGGAEMRPGTMAPWNQLHEAWSIAPLPGFTMSHTLSVVRALDNLIVGIPPLGWGFFQTGVRRRIYKLGPTKKFPVQIFASLT
jgi:hypothetical protein